MTVRVRALLDDRPVASRVRIIVIALILFAVADVCCILRACTHRTSVENVKPQQP